MFKKITMFLLVLMLALSPGVTFAAESTSSEDNDASKSEEKEEYDETDDEAESGEQVGDDEASEEEDEGKSGENKDKADEGDKEDSKSDKDSEDANDEEDDAAEAGGETEDESEEADNISAAVEDETLEIGGTASGEIEYDFDKGQYVLDLQAGLQPRKGLGHGLEQKWVAFALPDGVDMLEGDENPEGVAPVTLQDGHHRIAVKIPDVGSFPESEYTHLEIPLTGEVDPDYNTPNENLYMFDYDEEADSFEDLGRLHSTRDIVFSVMDENPELDMEGSVTGKVQYNQDDRMT